jgi:hypothetical protein
MERSSFVHGVCVAVSRHDLTCALCLTPKPASTYVSSFYGGAGPALFIIAAYQLFDGMPTRERGGR